MMHYKKGKNVEEELSQEQIPIEVLPERFLWMHVKGGSAVMNLIEHAKKALEDGTYRSVVWSGSDGGVGKTVSCAEILKRHFELHQVTRICYRKVEEFWDPQEDGLEQIVAKRNIPCMHILMSLDEIDPKVPGYQHSKAQGGFWTGAGLTGATEGPRKRNKEGGDKKSNYFTGPQLKKKANRHYANGSGGGEGPTGNGANRQGPFGKGKGRGGDAGEGASGGSRNKAKSKDGHRRKTDGGDGEVSENGGKKVAAGRRDGRKLDHNQSADCSVGEVMDTNDGPTSRKVTPSTVLGITGKEGLSGNQNSAQ
ncbi:ribonuclease P protein subunit p25-like protein [Anopheles nili]|uniref:ribonuclease P protein subunit p25-like protein n=1 Tax=Anopheles nili TaxID=185578 RepID=UPI00237BAFF3|nr:ribonuclease P protein subunit p25-like protein [Anopheles nili]